MARQTIVSYLDDLDGSPAQGEIPFGLDGVNYEIDLSEENANKLRDALAPFIAAARRVGGGRTAPARSASSTSGRSREENQVARTWLSENGYKVSERGRISNELWAAFESRTPAQKFDEPEQVAEEVPTEPVAEAPEKPKRSRRSKATEESSNVVELATASGE